MAIAYVNGYWSHEMGTAASMSTLRKTVFSGKLSLVTTHSDDPTQIKPSSEPASADRPAAATAPKAREIGGRDGPEPTRFGDWELRGRCIDF
ncbi:MAG: succinate dehydrogenase assembly factor 4 [Gammaproteobacteria bacterium]